MEKIRIQKIMSDSGVCSRRKAEEYISEGRVKVNGRPCKLGDKALAGKDIITLDGEKIYVTKKRQLYYIMLHKPRGYVTTMSDELDRKCVTELLTKVPERVYPIGRLVAKTYRVTVRPDINDEQLIKLASGVEIDGKMTQECSVVVLDKQPGRVVLQMTIHEGRNRQIRKMCEAVGLEVARLKRTAIGPIKLGMLKPGEYRELKPDELRALRNAITKK